MAELRFLRLDELKRRGTSSSPGREYVLDTWETL